MDYPIKVAHGFEARNTLKKYPIDVTVKYWQLAASAFIMKTCLYNVDPHKPHFYIVKLGFIGVHIIFHISAQNIDCGYPLEPPRRGGSNEYPQSMFLSRHKKILEFLSEMFYILLVNFPVYLNRLVFVMYRLFYERLYKFCRLPRRIG